MDEEKIEEKTEEKEKSEADKKVEQLNADTERINQAIAENENAKARQKLGGVTEGVQKEEEKHEETPREYADRVMSNKLE